MWSNISIIMIFVSKSSNLCETTPHFAWQKICLFGLTWDASITDDDDDDDESEHFLYCLI